MLFNSFPFLFLFLPLTLAGFFVLGRINRLWAAGWLALASLFFYGYWSPAYIPLLLGSICFNYTIGARIRSGSGAARRRWTALAIAANLAVLGYYKYADFFIRSYNDIAAHDLALLHVVMPIGISFFTFTQIAFLVDTYQGKVSEARFVHYVLFVTYFPHLIAGPVLHHKEMMPQFDSAPAYRPHASNFAVGLTIFIIGLAKKLLVADQLAPHAAAFFDQGATPSLLVAWGGVLAYAFQLYFDFSGYSDMAIGLSRLFGIHLPLNFNSPYKAVNIIDFWRRWHMTLSRFLRDYLYIALGGNRHGPARRYLNLMATMVLGGLWHGAGWNYVVWGALHGAYLMINHFWQGVSARLGLDRRSRAATLWATALTFVAVCFAWVFFRASGMARALEIVHGMVGGYGIALPDAIGAKLGGLGPWLNAHGIGFYMGGGQRFIDTYSWTLLAAALAFLMPNTQQIMTRHAPALDFDPLRDQAAGRIARQLVWQPGRRWACWIAVLALCSLLSLSRPAEFLYFQF